MNIQSKLLLVFITLLVVGVTAVSSYSIVFIRGFLLTEGKEQMARDTKQYALTIAQLDSLGLHSFLESVQSLTPYEVNIIPVATLPEQRWAKPDTLTGQMIRYTEWQVSIFHDKELEELTGLTELFPPFETYMLAVQLHEDQLFEPIKTIRWIIYTGMFISIGLIIVVSLITARSISKPILDLTDAACAIAEGQKVIEPHTNRPDEIGSLARSLQRMATTLRSDTDRIQAMYDRHRQFYADIAHEIKNPLHTIRGSLEILGVEGISAEEQQTYVQSAIKQVDRLNRLFTDLLSLQRNDLEGFHIEKKSFLLRPLLEGIPLHHHSSLEKQGVEIHIYCPDLSVYADPNKIEQVLDNLVLNALRHSKGNTIWIDVNASDEQVIIRVRDNGQGIDNHHKSRIFDRFYRAEPSRSRDSGGTGLGLAVVKSILAAHGSEIQLEESEQGATFRFSLPKYST